MKLAWKQLLVTKLMFQLYKPFMLNLFIERKTNTQDIVRYFKSIENNNINDIKEIIESTDLNILTTKIISNDELVCF